MTLEPLFRQFLKAYQEKDLQGIAGLLTPQVTLRDWNLEVQGAEAFLQETAKNFQAAQTLKIQVLSVFETPGTVAGELVIFVDDYPPLKVVDVFEFNDQGLLTASRAYKG